MQSSTQLVCCDTDVNRFLAGQARKIKSSQPDGNCLFRCFSYQLLGTEDEHIAVRSLLVRFENLNQETFAPYLMSVNSPTMGEHISKMLRPYKWGTHIELLAMATYYQVPVYYCCSKNKELDLHWEYIKPLDNQQRPLQYMHLDGNCLEDIASPSHFELYWVRKTHYDSVVSIIDGKLCSELPKLHSYPSQFVDLTKIHSA